MLQDVESWNFRLYQDEEDAPAVAFPASVPDSPRTAT